MVREGKQPMGQPSGNTIVRCCWYKPCGESRSDTVTLTRKDLSTNHVRGHVVSGILELMRNLNLYSDAAVNIITSVLDEDKSYNEILKLHVKTLKNAKHIEDLAIFCGFEIGGRPGLFELDKDDNDPLPKHITVTCRDGDYCVRRQRVTMSFPPRHAGIQNLHYIVCS